MIFEFFGRIRKGKTFSAIYLAKAFLEKDKKTDEQPLENHFQKTGAGATAHRSRRKGSYLRL